MKKILVILGHPAKKSFCKALYEKYIEGAKKSGFEVKSICLPDLKFDPILHEGYHEKQKLEPDLKKSQELIKWADHLVFIYPTWWWSVPALLKGFIDRIFLPGFAFRYKKGSAFPDRYFKGKSARLVVTTGGPRWIYFFIGKPGIRVIKKGVLMFAGVRPVRKTFLYSIRDIPKERVKKIFKRVKRLGEKGI